MVDQVSEKDVTVQPSVPQQSSHVATGTVGEDEASSDELQKQSAHTETSQVDEDAVGKGESESHGVLKEEGVGQVANLSQDLSAQLEISDEAIGEGRSRKGVTSMKAIQLLGYQTEEQIYRAKALEKLGLSEEDMYLSSPHFKSAEKQERIRKLFLERGYSGKVKQLTGMTEEQILRKKAVDTLGTDEVTIDNDRVRTLASLGADTSPRASDKAPPSCLN